MKKLIKKGLAGITLLPEVTITAPRKYFVGYDSNGNPLYTTNYSESLLAQQLPEGDIEESRKQWAFENIGSDRRVKPGLHGDATDLAKAAELGIGTALAPVALAPIASSLVHPAMLFMSSPIASTAKLVGAENVAPYAEATDKVMIGAAGLHGLKKSIKDWRHGEIPWYQAIPLIGISGLMSRELLNGKTMFNIVGLLPDVNGSRIINFLRTPITENPFKGMYTYQAKRGLASRRPLLGIKSERSYTTTTEDPIGLLRKRVTGKPWSKYRVIDGKTPEGILDEVPIREHTSLILSFKDLKNMGESTWDALQELPLYYTKLNLAPGISCIHPKNSFVSINPAALRKYKFDKDLALAHELAHELWHLGESRSHPSYYDAFYNNTGLPTKISDYLDPNELAARGTLLKNYFGIADDTPITGDMLKYAAKHYVLDTGLNNNMNQMFRMIKDWDKAAEWFSKVSYKHGGKLK